MWNLFTWNQSRTLLSNDMFTEAAAVQRCALLSLTVIKIVGGCTEWLSNTKNKTWLFHNKSVYFV